MTAAQMLAHCSVSMQWAVGEVVPEEGALPARLMGRLVKPMVFRNEDPLRKNSPTAKSLFGDCGCDPIFLCLPPAPGGGGGGGGSVLRKNSIRARKDDGVFAGVHDI